MTSLRAPEPSVRPTPSTAAFGSLVDLALISAMHSSVDVCGLCRTVNRKSSRACKCCGHRLPASYASADSAAPSWTARAHGIVQGEGFDVVALCLVLNLLLFVERFIPGA